jgi:selenide,water dikinase
MTQFVREVPHPLSTARAHASCRPTICAPCSASCGFDASRPNPLAGLDTADDAAVYRSATTLRSSSPPTSSRHRRRGRLISIAATNALSDVRDGGAPILASTSSRGREGLPFDLLARVLDGGGDVVRAAGALVGGGHSIDDPEPKFGLAVVGTVHPDGVFTNRGARPGDALVLTKPIGLGVISTAVKRDSAAPALVDEAVRVMTTLNAGARRRRRHR